MGSDSTQLGAAHVPKWLVDLGCGYDLADAHRVSQIRHAISFCGTPKHSCMGDEPLWMAPVFGWRQFRRSADLTLGVPLDVLSMVRRSVEHGYEFQ